MGICLFLAGGAETWSLSHPQDMVRVWRASQPLGKSLKAKLEHTQTGVPNENKTDGAIQFH
jgi:hypothetical protein